MSSVYFKLLVIFDLVLGAPEPPVGDFKLVTA